MLQQNLFEDKSMGIIHESNIFKIKLGIHKICRACMCGFMLNFFSIL